MNNASRLSKCHWQLIEEVAARGQALAHPVPEWAARAKDLLARRNSEVDEGIPLTALDDPFKSCCLVWSLDQPLDFGSGVFLGGRIVLTAAHVVSRPAPYAVSLPCLDWYAKERNQVNVKKAILRKHTCGAGGLGDLAILLLEDVPAVDDYPKLANLEDFKAGIADGNANTICGFGAASDEIPIGEVDRRGIKRKGPGIPIFSRQPQEVPDKCFNPDFEFVGGGKTATGLSFDACNGDSGGPLYLAAGGTQTVIGITSRTLVGDCGTGAIFTRVDAHRDWICATAAELGSPIC